MEFGKLERRFIWLQRHYILVSSVILIMQIKQKQWNVRKNHKALETATIIGEYKSLKSIPDVCPTKIKVKFKGSDKWIEYKR